MSFALRRILAALGAGTALTAVVAVAPPSVVQAPTASAVARCQEGSGTDASATYQAIFSGGRSINHFLTDYVPQGLGIWPNWNGGSEDLFLVGMHHRDENSHRSLVYGISKQTGAVRGYATLPVGAHVGGLKTYRNWLFVQQDTGVLRRYSLTRLRNSFRGKRERYLGAGQPQAVTQVSFFDIDNDYLYGGKFNPDDRDVMRRYRINGAGDLARDPGWGPVQVPKKAQGRLVLSNRFIFSTSGGQDERGNIYVVRRGYTDNFEDKGYRCFQARAMNQELVGFEGRTYLSYESGAAAFTHPINRTKRLHVASTETLRGLLG